ncbi:MAG: hypothetical protein AAGF92_21760 [Myxococcota bacterium]
MACPLSLLPTLAFTLIILCAVACGDSQEEGPGNTTVRFEAPVTYSTGGWDFECGEPEPVAPDVLDDVVGGTFKLLEPVEAGTPVEGFFDLPTDVECQLRVDINNLAGPSCTGTGIRPVGETAVVVLEFECD